MYIESSLRSNTFCLSPNSFNLSLIGSIYVASAETGDDSIYNMSRPTTKIKLSFLFSQEEKKIEKLIFLLFKNICEPFK